VVQSFRCQDCGCAWTATVVRPPATTITEGAGDITPPPCIKCGAPSPAVVDETTGVTRFECSRCGTLFTPPGETR